MKNIKTLELKNVISLALVVLMLFTTLVSNSLAQEIQVEDLDSEYVTRAEFIKELYKIYEKYGKEEIKGEIKKFNDTDDKEILLAVALGIAKGADEYNFNPGKEITREQAAVMMDNLIRVLKLDIAVTEQWIIYKDMLDIGSYALNSVMNMDKLGIIKGVSVSEMNPKGRVPRIHQKIMLERLVKVVDSNINK